MNRWLDRSITLLLVALLGWAGWSLLHWLLHTADWSVVTTNLPLYAVGSFPADQRWRPLLWMVGLITLTLLTLFGPKRGPGRRWLPLLWIAMAPLGLWLLAGGLGLLPVGTRSWGGLTLTLLLTGGSGALALPLGILLALGRRSDLPVLRWSSAAYIELMRAVPLIAVLFFGQLLIPLFLPPGLEINRVLRAVVAFALFAAAYIAEDVRGGLQAIPPTQREAAAVLGLSSTSIAAIGGAAAGVAGGASVAHQPGGGSPAKHKPDGHSRFGGIAGHQPQPLSESRFHRSLSGGVPLACCGLLAGVYGDGSAGPAPGTSA